MAEEQVSKDEQIGFHKGALKTLAAERQELARILDIVEQLMQMHVKGLQDLGIDLTKEVEKVQKEQKADSKPIEDIIKK
ncbi:hypothetical protein GOV08_00305 [Candidatus Woesearchaeota archaeon]|nr:hypothetical protein [Candidatus Woesearchaeota archaeon]